MAATAEAPKPQLYPIAEIFDSIQGEGRWTGTPMRFIRLAGCNVGQRRNVPTNLRLEDSGVEFRVLDNHPEHTACRLWDDGVMLCDTNYTASFSASADELLRSYPGGHICITGGEPFLHKLTPLVLEAQALRYMVHIETSGTLPITFAPTVNRAQLWITCSPKKGMIITPDQIAAIDELKILVDVNTKAEQIFDLLTKCLVGRLPDVYIQPISTDIHHLNSKNLQRAIDLVTAHPGWKLSAQLHKVWGVR